MACCQVYTGLRGPPGPPSQSLKFIPYGIAITPTDGGDFVSYDLSFGGSYELGENPFLQWTTPSDITLKQLFIQLIYTTPFVVPASLVVSVFFPSGSKIFPQESIAGADLYNNSYTIEQFLPAGSTIRVNVSFDSIDTSGLPNLIVNGSISYIFS